MSQLAIGATIGGLYVFALWDLVSAAEAARDGKSAKGHVISAAISIVLASVNLALQVGGAQ